MEKGIKLGGIFRIKCFDPKRNLKWETESKNLVVNEGLNHILDTIFALGGEVANTSYFIGLTDGTPTISANDVLASHAGWTEVTAYSEASRQEYVETRTALVVDNSAAKAIFSMNSSSTVGGAFISSAASGTSGMLLAASAFANGDKAVDDGDTIECEYSFSAASTW